MWCGRGGETAWQGTQQLPSLPGGPGRAVFAFIYYCRSRQALIKASEHNGRLSHHLAGGSDCLAVGSVGDPVGTYRGRSAVIMCTFYRLFLLVLRNCRSISWGLNLITNATKKSTFRVDVTHVNLRQRLLFVGVASYLWQTVAEGRDGSADPNQITGTVP